MRAGRSSVGCLLVLAITGAGLALIAAMNPMATGFLGVMSVGIVKGALGNVTYVSHEAVVVGYGSICAPKPTFVSRTQPSCKINGQDGARLQMVRLKYKTAFGNWNEGVTKLPTDWGRPPAGSHVTILVSLVDSSRFKTWQFGPPNPGY